MKGIFLRARDTADSVGPIAKLDLDVEVAHFDLGSGNRGFVRYEPRDWPQGPVWTDGDRAILASGWLSYRGKLGDIGALARDWFGPSQQSVVRALQAIDDGAYALVAIENGSIRIATDPFGLHPHFIRRVDAAWSVAPAPVFLRAGTSQDPDASRILSQLGHLFGDATLFAGVTRVPPGTVWSNVDAVPWFRYAAETASADEILSRLGGALAVHSDRARVLPLSGGLDSRLLLACGEFDAGFTFGPEATGDRPVARKFAGEFDEYDEFSLAEIDARETEQAGVRAMLLGMSRDPLAFLAPVYRRVRDRVGRGVVVADGYLGDLLQRGNYLAPVDVKGAARKLFPVRTLRGWTDESFLRARYPDLSLPDFGRLFDDYSTWVRAFRPDLPRPWCWTLFEAVRGRGARNALHGGTLTGGLYATIVHPFWSPRVVAAFMGQDPENVVSYRFLRQLWRGVSPTFRDVRTYSGFFPADVGWKSRWRMLATKSLGRLALYSRSRSYETEIAKIPWR